MNREKLTDRYDDAYLVFSDSFKDVQKVRTLWYQHKLDNPCKAQRAQLKIALENAEKFYAVAVKLYKVIAKEYKKTRDVCDDWDLGYIRAEIREVNFNVWRLSNMYGKDKVGKRINFPKAPSNLAN